jgi:monothiol glutaredoxin
MRPEVKTHIESLIKNNAVILFMKGTKERPQCGFSKQVIVVLNELLNDFATVDVLADPEIREGIKTFSNWPTIPQLYINQEFIGGCDIVLDLAEKNQLHEMLKLEKALSAPQISLSPSAEQAFINALADQAEGESIRITIGANFAHSLEFDKATKNDFLVNINNIELIFDPYSAHRAHNLSIDFIEDQLEAGFAFNNPNEAAQVQELSVQDFLHMRSQGEEMLLIDVRPHDEWELAHISFAKRLDDFSASDIAALDPNLKLVFHCHHGGRSKRVAESFRTKGFKHLFNLSGGIDAWSRRVDSNVPTY